nr:DUF2771 family protein [Gordonia humi]
MHPGDKKPLTILAAAVAVVVVAIAALTTVLVLTDDDGDAMPTVSVQAGDSLERVAPGYWCSVDLTDCDPVDPRSVQQLPQNIVHIAAPIGDPVRVTVPPEVADGPWWSVAQYATPRGVQRVVEFSPSDTLYTKKFLSEPDAVLLGIEIWSPSTVFQDAPQGVESVDGEILMRGTFTIDTVPDGFTVGNTTELPDVRR